MPSLFGEVQSNPTQSSKTDDTSKNSTANAEFENTSSQASFDSDRDEHSSGIESEPLSENEREILQVVEREPSVELESELPEPKTTVPKRNPLPNSRAKRSASPSASRKPVSTMPLRVVKRGAKWSDQEDSLLKRLKNRGMSWQDVSNQLPGRSSSACSRRYHRALSIPLTTSRSLSPPATASRRVSIPMTTPRRGKWSPEEVAKLHSLRDAGVEWEELAKQLPGRTSAACRRKCETLMKWKDKSSAKPKSKIEQGKPETAIEDEQAEGSSDEEMSERDIVQEKPKRAIDEESYSSSSDEDMSESDIDDQGLESKVKEEEPASVIEDEKAESRDDDMFESTSEEDPSESESEDEAEKRRKHATFFLKR
jgi:hypothetical protein